MGKSQIIDRKRIKSIIMILISNGITLLAGIMTGFIVPKMMSITDYGYYKIFNLYFGYLPVLHFGLSTGIYLLYGDKSYDELNRDHFRFYFRLLVASQLLISTLFILMSCFLGRNEYIYIIWSLAVVLVASNITNYFQLISQVTERYKEYSVRNIIQSVLSILVIGVLFWKSIHYHNEVKCWEYLCCIILIQIVLAGWYIWTYRDIVFGKISNRPSKQLVLNIYKKGFILIIAGLVALLILNIDRQFVSLLYSTEEYAIYAFAYSIITLMTTFINAISTIIYPSIKREKEEYLHLVYEKFISVMIIISSLLISSSFVLDIIIKWALPKYLDSLQYLYIITPTLIISSLINVVIHNYYKTLNIENYFFIISVLILIQSSLANYIAYRFVGTMASISIASVFCMICWYIYTQLFLRRIFKFKYVKSSLYMVLVFAIFYLIYHFEGRNMIGLTIYLSAWILLSVGFFPRYFKELLTMVLNRT